MSEAPYVPPDPPRRQPWRAIPPEEPRYPPLPARYGGEDLTDGELLEQTAERLLDQWPAECQSDYTLALEHARHRL